MVCSAQCVVTAAAPTAVPSPFAPVCATFPRFPLPHTVTHTHLHNKGEVTTQGAGKFLSSRGCKKTKTNCAVGFLFCFLFTFFILPTPPKDIIAAVPRRLAAPPWRCFFKRPALGAGKAAAVVERRSRHLGTLKRARFPTCLRSAGDGGCTFLNGRCATVPFGCQDARAAPAPSVCWACVRAVLTSFLGPIRSWHTSHCRATFLLFAPPPRVFHGIACFPVLTCLPVVAWFADNVQRNVSWTLQT